MRKSVFLCVLLAALLAAVPFAGADNTAAVIHGQILIDGLPAGADEEGLFSLELLDRDMLPVIDEFGMPVQAVNGADGSFVLRVPDELSGGTDFHVRQTDDTALGQIYTLDTGAHPVTVEPDGKGGYTVLPNPVVIRNLQYPVDVTVFVEWRGTFARPASVTLDIYRDGKYLLTETRTPGSDGSITFVLPEFNRDGAKSEYFFIQQPVDGYRTGYANPAPREAETGKAYDGGTIINTDEPVPPETGDHTPLALFAVLGVVSAAVFALLSRRRGY